MDKELLIISAIWCPSCLILKKNIKKINKNYPNLIINTLDYDLDEDIVSQYDVGNKLPVLISKIDGKEVSRLIGEKSYDEIVRFLKEGNLV